jgi:hypothetical protein
MSAQAGIINYTLHLIEEAYGFYNDEDSAAEYDSGRDDELGAQIELVQRALVGGDPDEVAYRARHLRGMLLISYADPEDLPAPPVALEPAAERYLRSHA